MLRVWLPLNGDLHNQGCSNPNISLTSGNTWASSGKIGNSSLTLTKLQTILPTSSCMSGAKEVSYCYWVKVNTAWSTNWLDGIRWIETDGSATSTARQEFYTNCTLVGTWYKGGSISGKAFTPGVWTHLAATFNYNTGEANFYIDGVLKGTTTNIDKTYYCRGDFYIGDNGVDICQNDVRIYDHALSAAEIKEISQGLVLHYKLDGFQDGNGNPNLGNTSATYSNQTNGTTITANTWGGDAGTVTFYHSGGYNGLPYKIYHKTATGSGGIYKKTADDIVIESGITYTMSCWIKADRQFTASNYSFNINRGVGNRYITYGSGFTIYTDWHYYSKTFTATDDDAGNYGEMSIIYDDAVTDYYVYYSGFKIEKGSVATPWCSPNASLNIIQDSSGYGHNGAITGTIAVENDTPRYFSSIYMNGSSYILTPAGSFAWNDLTQLTFSAWMKPTASMTGWRGSVGIAADSNQTARGIAITDYGNEFRGTYTNGSGYQTVATGKTLNQNEWHHCASTLNGTEFKLYFDGVLVKTQAIDWGTATLNANARFEVGVDLPGTDEKFTGNYSDIRCYCTALDADAIRQLYHTSAKADNLGGFHTFEFSETNNGLELLAVPLTTSYGNRTNIYTNYNTNGEITLTGSSSIGSDYIKINPTDKTYYYDFELSIDANNQIYLGFERFDAAKTSRSNSACMYAVAVKPSTAVSHVHYHGTINIGTAFDSNTPVDTIAVCILNDWSGAAGRSMTIHKMSLREVSTLQNTKINKYGQTITTELIEMNDKFCVQKNGIIEANEFLEL